MADIVVDTNVLLVGSGKSNSVRAKGARTVEVICSECVILLNAIHAHATLCLAVDEKGYISGEYLGHLKDPGCLAMQILTHYSKSNRIRKYDMDSRAWKPIRLALSKQRFHNPDHKFVKTAAASESKVLVSEEQGFTDEVCRVLQKKASVSAVTSDLAISHVA